MTLTRDEKLKAKREAEAERAARIKRARTLLEALPDNDRAEVNRVANRLEREARARGERTASVSFLEDALTAHNVQADLAKQAKAERGEPAIAVKITVGSPVTRHCAKCDRDLPESEFSRHRSSCRECYNRAWREWNAAKKAKAAS